MPQQSFSQPCNSSQHPTLTQVPHNMKTWTVKIKGDVDVVVPADLNCLTTYVLLEQEDWFEDEMEFVRQYVKPGMNCIDVGACFGVYARTMAKLTGPTGKVWAFEPGEVALECLRKEKPENLEVLDIGLSDKSKSAAMNLKSPEYQDTEEGNEICLSTLDEWWSLSGKPPIDIIKIDAGKDSARVIQGAVCLLNEINPIIIVDKTLVAEILAILPLRYSVRISYDKWSCKVFTWNKNSDKQDGFNTIFCDDRTFNEFVKCLDSYNLESYIDVIVDHFRSGENDFRSDVNSNSDKDFLDLLKRFHRDELLAMEDFFKGILIQPVQTAWEMILLVRYFLLIGERRNALNVLSGIVKQIETGRALRLELPTLPPFVAQDKTFKQYNSYSAWMVNCVLKAYIQLGSASTYFDTKRSYALAKVLLRKRIGDLEIVKKFALSAALSGESFKIGKDSPLLRSDSRNAEVWTMIAEVPLSEYTQKPEKERKIKRFETLNRRGKLAEVKGELEDYIRQNPDDVKLFHALVKQYAKSWLPTIEECEFLISQRKKLITLKEDKLTGESIALIKLIGLLLSRVRGVEIGKQKLAQFENIHKGERCVLIGNGPSLNKMDLSFLKDEICIGMNRIYLGFDRFGFEPTYHICVNPAVLQQSGKEMLDRVRCPKFFSFEAIPHLDPDVDAIFLNTRKIRSYFHPDPRVALSLGSTVTFGAMQLAYYMGFSEVVLIGVDHYFETKGQPHKLITSQGDDPNHFDPNYFGKGYNWQLPDLEDSEQSYKEAKIYYEAAGRRIVDATVDGRLQVFPKVDYKEFFSRAHNNAASNYEKSVQFISGLEELSSILSISESAIEAIGQGSFQSSYDFEHGQKLLIDYLLENYNNSTRVGSQMKTIIEIGTTREDLPGQSSTLKIAKVAKHLGMLFTTVDMDEENSNRVREELKSLDERFSAVSKKGEDFLAEYNGLIDFLFLDAFDFDHGQHSLDRKSRYREVLGVEISNEACYKMHLDCVTSSIWKFSDDAIVVFDDTWRVSGRWEGKGATAVPFLLENGFSILKADYKAVMLKKGKNEN